MDNELTNDSLSYSSVNDLIMGDSSEFKYKQYKFKLWKTWVYGNHLVILFPLKSIVFRWGLRVSRDTLHERRGSRKISRSHRRALGVWYVGFNISSKGVFCSIKTR